MEPVFSIGHSNHPEERFLALLTRHAIEVLVDVRSQPYSKHAPHFCKPALQKAVASRGVTPFDHTRFRANSAFRDILAKVDTLQ